MWQTDTQTPHDGIGRACIASRGKNAQGLTYYEIVHAHYTHYLMYEECFQPNLFVIYERNSVFHLLAVLVCYSGNKWNAT